jgi:phage terminase small subunit
MRLSPLWLCLYLLFPVPMMAQGVHPRPPGITEGQKQIDKPLESPMEMRDRKLNVEQVKQEADELRKLADGVPAQIEMVTKNQYPKDLSDNLKRIERLAKHLRSEVTP